MVLAILGATDHPWLIPHRQAHCLRLVELGVLEGRQPDQAVRQRLRKLRFVEVEEISHGYGQRCRHRAGQSLLSLRRAFPRFLLILLSDEGNIERMRAAGGAQDRRFDIVRRHGLHRRQEGPLVRMRP